MILAFFACNSSLAHSSTHQFCSVVLCFTGNRGRKKVQFQEQQPIEEVDFEGEFSNIPDPNHGDILEYGHLWSTSEHCEMEGVLRYFTNGSCTLNGKVQWEDGRWLLGTVAPDLKIPQIKPERGFGMLRVAGQNELQAVAVAYCGAQMMSFPNLIVASPGWELAKHVIMLPQNGKWYPYVSHLTLKLHPAFNTPDKLPEQV